MKLTKMSVDQLQAYILKYKKALKRYKSGSNNWKTVNEKIVKAIRILEGKQESV